MNVEDLMTLFPETIDANASTDEIRKKMTAHGCKHLPVMQGDHLIGVVSDRDIGLGCKLGDLKERSPLKAQDIMADAAYMVQPDLDVRLVIEEMLKEKISSVIIRGGTGKPWGIFTTTDALKYITELPEAY